MSESRKPGTPGISAEAVILSHAFDQREQLTAGVIYLISGISGILLCLVAMKAVMRGFTSPHWIPYFHLYLANFTMAICSLFASLAAFHGRWPLSEEACQAYATVSFIGGMAAICFTSLLALDAYIAVYWKEAYACLSSKPYHVMVVLVWTQACIWAILPLSGFSSYSLEPVGITCEISWLRTDSNHTTFLTLLIGLGFSLPFSLAAFFLFLAWCCPVVHQTEVESGEKPWLWTWLQPSYDHQVAILKASTMHLLSSLIVWSPYAVICILPFYYQPLPLPPLAIIAPSIVVKAGIALQALILPFCSSQVRNNFFSGKTHKD